MADSPLTLEEAIRKLTTHQISLAKTLQTMALKLDELLHRLPPMLPDPTTSSPSPTPTASPVTTHKIKLDVPRFDGTDPLGWIFKITQFFEYNQTPENERLTALQTHFAPSQYEDPTGILFKLTQRGTVAEYLSAFEDLANHMIGLPPPFLLSCFVSGLTPEIRREVQAHQPLTLVQAAGLARLQEEKILDARLHLRPKPPPPLPSPSLGQPFPLRTINPSPTPLLPTPSCPPPPTVKRLTSEELATHRERGLCFNCDERYHRGHQCSSRVFLLISEDEDSFSPQIEQPNPQPEPKPDPADPYPAQISFNSIAGNVAPETLRFMGAIGDRHVVLLVDGGSTHNFIQHQLVSQLGLTPRTTTPLRVMVGTFVELKGDTETTQSSLSSSQFHRLLHIQPESLYLHVTDLQEDDPSVVAPAIDPIIQELIDRFHLLLRPRSIFHRRGPQITKQEIETQVELMLQKGLIQPSNSSFSSPVLTRALENPAALYLLFLLPPEICWKPLGRHPHCPTFISILSETARWNPQNLLSKKSRRKPYIAVGTVGRRKPYTALGTVVGAQSSKLSTLPVNKLIVLYVVFKLDESYTLSKVSILAGDGFHNLKEIKTVELVKPTGWVYLSLSGADPR
ncbi:Anaphase-promoting complex subunit 10 [Glycine soja]|uniref:Anaphase-promoting complex subunit 10 n=1 Tax=Glycine soja TaxID=3848 RepID=A0A445H703_GLYSO|nr:Anaphase-promoting complex subunit 10 [Glycine soja]